MSLSVAFRSPWTISLGRFLGTMATPPHPPRPGQTCLVYQLKCEGHVGHLFLHVCRVQGELVQRHKVTLESGHKE